MSLPWPHHIICKAPMDAKYTFKIWAHEIWKGDGPAYYLSLELDNQLSGEPQEGRIVYEPIRLETMDDVVRWVDGFNAVHSQWVCNGKEYVRRALDQVAQFKPCQIPAGMRRRTFYCVVAQRSIDKKDWDGVPNGLYFYPRDRESKTECEAIVAELQEDLKAL